MKQLQNIELLEPYMSYKGQLEYYNKTTDQIILIANGFLTLDKPQIQKHFCYGYDDFGIQGGYAQAHELAEATRKHTTIFIKENLNLVNRETQMLENNEAFLIPYFRDRYYNSQTPIKPWWELVDSQTAERELANDNPVHIITEEERKILLEAYYQRAKNFKKRLLTYCKKYGTSKLKVWTYLVD